MSDDRKATDVLLDLEKKLDDMLRFQRNMDNNMKILLSQVNMFMNKAKSNTVKESVVENSNNTNSEFSGIINSQNFDNRPKTNKFVQMAAAQGIEIDDAKSTQQRIVTHNTSPEYSGDELLEASPRKVSPRGSRGPKTTSNKSTVSQELKKADGQPLFLASVEILNEDGSVEKQTRTNPKGKWMAALSPGNYTVRVIKFFAPDSGYKPIDTSYQIQVSQADAPLELNPLTVNSDG
jgi:hypothetical protein